MKRVPALILALIGLIAAGCANTANRQIEVLDRPTGTAEVVLMPLDVELFELDAAGIQNPKADWTDAAQQNLMAAFDTASGERGLNIARYDDTSASPETIDALFQIQKLHGVVGASVIRHQYMQPYALPSKKGKFDWTLGPSVTPLRDASGADYALFTYVRDSYSSPDRVALIIGAALFGISVQGGVQTGFASLVDLETGDIVWFNRLFRAVGDLRTPEAARETAYALLTGFPK